MMGRRTVVLVFWSTITAVLAALPIDGQTLLVGRDLTGALEWAEAAPPAMVVAALTRAAAVLGAAYLSAASLLFFVAALVPSAGVVARLVPRGTARLLGAMVGVAAVVGVPAAAAEEPSTSDRRATMQPVTISEVVVEPAPTTATMTWVEPAPIVAPASTTPPIAEDPNAPSRTWEVRCGEHFWTIAEATLDQRTDGVGLEQHWRELIELNRAQLPDPSNPDLILPGMLLRLP